MPASLLSNFLSKACLPVLLAGMQLQPAHALEADAGGLGWDINGFYSLSALHTDQSGPFFLYAPYGDQDRPADQQHWDLLPDSKLGLMAGVRASAQLSAKAQFLYRQGSSKENDFKTRLAFVEYQPRYDWSIKLGRSVQGLLLTEESMYTDYAQLPIRAPQEPYAYLPNTEIDGIHLQHQLPMGDWRLNLQGSYGQRTYHSQQFLRELRDSVGIAATLLNPQTSLHLAARTLMLGYSQSPGLASATQLIRSVASAQGHSDIAAEYDEAAIRVKQYAAGLEHQAGPLSLKADLLLLYSSLPIAGQPVAAANLLAGYRFGALTPYVSWGQISEYGSKKEERLQPNSPQAIAAIFTADYLGAALSGEQRTWSLGLRYDVAKNTALKIQFDRVERKAGVEGWFIAPPDSLQFAPDYKNHTNVWGISLQGMF